MIEKILSAGAVLILVTLYASGQAHAEQDAGTITAPMPGMVIKVLVETGQAVEPGQGLMILEAMKMENQILCPRAGVVRSRALKH